MMYRPEYDMEVVGKNLKRLRENKELTVEEVREYLRLGSVQAVYKYERQLHEKLQSIFIKMLSSS